MTLLSANVGCNKKYMTDAQIRMLELIASFLSGSLIVGLIEWYRAHRASMFERRLQMARDQLGKLYGPIYFFTSQNQECFRISDRLHKALDSDKTHTVDNSGNRHSLLTSDEDTCTIQLSNEYVHIVEANNDQIVEVLRQNWMFVEAEDIALFRQMIVDHTRLKVEIGAEGKMKTPLPVYPELGSIPFMRAEFTQRIEERVRERLKLLKSA